MDVEEFKGVGAGDIEGRTYGDPLTLSDADLLAAYTDFVAEDPGVKEEALKAAWEMSQKPYDHLDKVRQTGSDAEAAEEPGMVNRRAPLNPFASPNMGKYRVGGNREKAADPAMRNNPLRGRLICCIATSCALMLVFLQSLVANKIESGSYHVSPKLNAMLGPAGEMLNALGGLNSNMIRAGEHIRLYWSMWMHSGWIHVLMNVLSQMQFLYMFEPDWGFWRTLFVFMVSGISGNLMSSILDPCTVTVGSSGALYGLMGATIIYCIEYWKSIPRPLCILIFTLIVLIISFITGFTGNTDNWAHLGGLIGGMLMSCATISSLQHCQECCCPQHVGDGPMGEDGRHKKKVVKRSRFAKAGKDIKPTCKCGWRESLLRFTCGAALFVFWFLSYWYLYRDFSFQPPGHVTFTGRSKCCCAFSPADSTNRGDWMCQPCTSASGQGTWAEFTEEQVAARRQLSTSEELMSGVASQNSRESVADLETLSRKLLSEVYSDGNETSPFWLLDVLELHEASLPFGEELAAEEMSQQVSFRGNSRVADLREAENFYRNPQVQKVADEEEMRRFSDAVEGWIGAHQALQAPFGSGAGWLDGGARPLPLGNVGTKFSQ